MKVETDPAEPADRAVMVYRRALLGVAVDGGIWQPVGAQSTMPLLLAKGSQLAVAPDGFVFVADVTLKCVQVFTAGLSVHGSIGAGHLSRPCGVCVDADVVVVSDYARVSVFSRVEASFVRFIGSRGHSAGSLGSPADLCLMPLRRHVAILDINSLLVSVFTLEGEFLRHVDVSWVRAVACSALDELIVCQRFTNIIVFNPSGQRCATINGCFVGAAALSGTLYALREGSCTVFA
jgi:hypothetical protein